MTIVNNSNVFVLIKQVIAEAVTLLQSKDISFSNISVSNLLFTVESPKNPDHGDIASNIAMVLASQIGQKPRDIAVKISNIIEEQKLFSDFKCQIKIAGPGFINFAMNEGFWQHFLYLSNQENMNYGTLDIGRGKKLNVEFVSANPTGPMHIGHARCAIYGDVLCNLLERVGFNVEREYYINDAGGQIDTLAKSLWIRYQQQCGLDIDLPNDCYPGDYLIDIAKELKLANLSINCHDQYDRVKDLLKDFSVKKIMTLIKKDLNDLRVHFDLFTSEKEEVIEKGRVDEVIAKLKAKKLIASGFLEEPKNDKNKEWKQREQLLFLSTKFGDDLDRPLIKDDGTYTYMASDIAYHKSKIDRGSEKLILLLGADHIGYIKRIKSAVEAASDKEITMDIVIMQLVNILDNGIAIKMSKRAGNFLLLTDVLQELHRDILRFLMMMRKGDSVLDLDFAKAKEQSKDNPIFYVQYAHTRAMSVINKAVDKGIVTKEEIVIAINSNEEISYYLNDSTADYTLLNHKLELNIIKHISLLPKIIEAAAVNYEPHKICFYLNDLATVFHSSWNLDREENYRFIDEKNKKLSKARIAMVYGVAKTIAICLKILGIRPMIYM